MNWLPDRSGPRFACLAACLGFAAGLASAPGALAVLPDEGDCPAVSGGPAGGTGDEAAQDAAPLLLMEGMVINAQDLLMLKQLFPPEIWRHREIFFHEGMRMLIGPCHRRYVIPEVYKEATRRFAGQPSLDKRGNLENYRAGVPFPPSQIHPTDEDAAARWAWNMEKRYRGAGFSGRFRIVDYPSSMGSIETFEGNFFLLKTSERADLADSGYALQGSKGRLFAAGGEFHKPFNARNLAWRQFRTQKADKKYDRTDDTFVYVPTMRKVRRASTGWVDGLYLPSFAMSGDSAGGQLPFGDVTGGSGTGISPDAGQSAAATLHTSRGMTGLSLRPNAYVWRMIGERDVLALINSSAQGWPSDERRNFGYSGLSFASDRWDVRWAIVIEGALREVNEILRTVTIYLDYQTLQPLYWISRTDKRRLLEIGVLAHRFTGDVFDYPEWPGGLQTTVFEPVAAAFYNALAGRGGWRRESYDLRSVPFSARKRRFMTSADALMRGH